ncbi:hypothetical protein GQ44DRAFT_728167 [Phaeosphaeriaceae sp. PMI808]|nr:hypothetical protein GQ44DRAFT_728167 [Phaeosphaeriaceae sp. PMI808]
MSPKKFTITSSERSTICLKVTYTIPGLIKLLLVEAGVDNEDSAEDIGTLLGYESGTIPESTENIHQVHAALEALPTPFQNLTLNANKEFRSQDMEDVNVVKGSSRSTDGRGGKQVGTERASLSPAAGVQEQRIEHRQGIVPVMAEVSDREDGGTNPHHNRTLTGTGHNTSLEDRPDSPISPLAEITYTTPPSAMMPLGDEVWDIVLFNV